MAGKPKQSKLSKILELLQKHVVGANKPQHLPEPNGSDVNDCERNVLNPLCIAVRDGNMDDVRLLLQHGADVNLMDCMERHPLFYALDNAHVECASLLLQHGADVKMSYQLPLLFVATMGHVPLAELLLEYGADTNYRRFEKTALVSAVSHGHLQMVELLLDHGADIKQITTLPTGLLAIADDVKSSDVLELLLRRGAGLSMESRHDYNCFSNSIDTCKKLLIAAFFVPKHTDDTYAPFSYPPKYPFNDEYCVEHYMEVNKQFEANLPRLMQLCRAVIRHRTLRNNPQSNLYYCLALLPLPKLLVNYLLYSDWPHFYYTK